MLIGIDLSMFVVGTVSVMNASEPTRCALMVATCAGTRTTGARGGPFLPQPATTKVTKRTTTNEDVFFTTKVTTFTKVIESYFVSFASFVVETLSCSSLLDCDGLR